MFPLDLMQLKTRKMKGYEITTVFVAVLLTAITDKSFTKSSFYAVIYNIVYVEMGQG